MNLQVPPELEAKLAHLAATTGGTVDQVAFDHDEVAARMDRRDRGWTTMRSKRAPAVFAAIFWLVPVVSAAATVNVDCDAGGVVGKAISSLKAGDTLVIS